MTARPTDSGRVAYPRRLVAYCLRSRMRLPGWRGVCRWLGEATAKGVAVRLFFTFPQHLNAIERMELTGDTITTDITKRRILVVDDNQDAADTMALLLKLTGYDVYTQYNGQAALEAAESLRPQVVISDISMPGMDGYQVSRLIREKTWGKTLLLIALSGYGQATDIQRSTEAGFDIHLIKPVDIVEIEDVLASSPLLS